MMYWSIIIYLELSSVFGIKGKVFIKKVSHLLFLCRVRRLVEGRLIRYVDC